MSLSWNDPYFVGGAILFAFAGVVAYFWMSSFLFGAGYQGAPRRSVEAMLRLADVRSGDQVVELGAGVGAVTFAAARERSAQVLAVEIEPLRYLLLRARRALGPSGERVEIERRNMYGVDLSNATVVTAFLWPGAMARLRPKFERELAPGTRVVSRCHAVPGWIPVEHDREADVLLYVWPRSGVGPAAPLHVGRLPGEPPDPGPPRAPV
jgi:SAM-dependent methyltransferase